MDLQKLGDSAVHVCSVESSAKFEDVKEHDAIHSRAVDQIRSVMRAMQVQFGEEIASAGEIKSRAIYSFDIQCSEDLKQQELQAFEFMPASEVDYNAAFKCLFFDECAGMTAL